MPPTKRQAAKKSASKPRSQPPAASSSTQFGQGWQRGDVSAARELTLPSGAVCLVRQVSTSDLIGAGLLEKLDLLTGIADKEIVQPAQKGKSSPDKVPTLKGSEALATLELCDKVTAMAVVDPKVKLAPTPRCRICNWEGMDENQHTDDHPVDLVPRDPNVIYTDGIPMGDKFEIMSTAVQGVAALNSFRE